MALIFFVSKKNLFFTPFPPDPYISESGKEVVTLVVMEESKQIMKLTRVHVKVPAGDNGARAGLLFVANQDPTSGEELTKKLEQYNGWTAEDYNKLKKEKYVWGILYSRNIWRGIKFGGLAVYITIAKLNSPKFPTCI